MLGGGFEGTGVVYRVDAARQETVLYSFVGGGLLNPSGVIRDSSGNLYGTTSGGGTAFVGVVFKLDAAGNETVLYNFTGGTDGSEPSAGVIQDSDGNLYGTTYGGGKGEGGVVFKIVP